VTVLEFSDFQCPYCIRARPTVARVRETYGDKVRWAFRHFPLPSDVHPLAQKAGEAAACADEQGKFWEMHDRLWASNGQLEVPALKSAAAAIGVDRARFDACLDSGRHADVVEKDLGAGSGWGVSGTPAFFVNGRLLVGAQPFEAFQQVIDDELERIGAASPAASR
jgi:protein-disulfide isomerase